jgi:hypothetical protein
VRIIGDTVNTDSPQAADSHSLSFGELEVGIRGPLLPNKKYSVRVNDQTKEYKGEELIGKWDHYTNICSCPFVHNQCRQTASHRILKDILMADVESPETEDTKLLGAMIANHMAFREELGAAMWGLQGAAMPPRHVQIMSVLLSMQVRTQIVPNTWISLLFGARSFTMKG